MSVSYRGSLQTTRMNAVVADIDNNASPASLEIATAAFATVLVSIPLGDPSFTVAGTPAVATMNGVPKSANASQSGTAAVARIKDGAGTTIVNNLTVGVSASDIILNSVSISSGQSVAISSGTISHPA